MSLFATSIGKRRGLAWAPWAARHRPKTCIKVRKNHHLLPRRTHQILSSTVSFHYYSSFPSRHSFPNHHYSAKMKFSAALVALVSGLGAVAAPIEDAAAQPISIEKRNPGGIDYNQNYNGGAAGYQSNLGTGKFSLKWNSGTDVVAGLGWKTGSARTITYSGQYSPGNSGSYLAVYGWINNPQAEYYIVEVITHSIRHSPVQGRRFPLHLVQSSNSFTVLRRLQPLLLRCDPARQDHRRRLDLRAVHRHPHQPALHHRHLHFHPVLVRQAEQAHFRHRHHQGSLRRLGQARLRQQELQLPGPGCRGFLWRWFRFHDRVLDGTIVAQAQRVKLF
jgi:hypothetical protein